MKGCYIATILSSLLPIFVAAMEVPSLKSQSLKISAQLSAEPD